MSAFTGPLVLREFHAGEFLWSIEQPLIYEVGELGSGQVISVPEKFITDGASIPRPLWWFLPAWGTYSRPAVLHDYLCARLDYGAPHPLAPTRRKCDAIFLESMQVTGVSLPIRIILWVGVRIGSVLPGHPPNYPYDKESSGAE